MGGAGDAHETEVVGDDLPALGLHLGRGGCDAVALGATAHQDGETVSLLGGAPPVGAGAPVETVEAVHACRIGATHIGLECRRYALEMGAKRFACGFAAAAALALLTANAGRSATALTLDVIFSANNTIAVTLPDGTPVGTASGTPNVIPAGYYTVSITGPMGLPSGLPYFHLSGPAVDLLSNLNEGGLESDTQHVTLQPSSLYTWTDDALPGLVYRFTTTADIQGAAPGTAVSPKSGKPADSQDVVGSDVVPLRGTLAVVVTAAGKLSVTFKGKSVGSLKPGSYRIAVTDRSAAGGLALATRGRPLKQVTGAGFVGRRSLLVTLTAGHWLFTGNAGKTGDSVVVSS